MKIGRRLQFVLFILLLTLTLWFLIDDLPEEKEKSYNISLIIRGKMDDGWSNLQKGAQAAAEDLNVNLRIVAAIEGNTAEEQIGLLQNEAEGTDAILIAPVNRVLLSEPVQELVKKKKPVVLIESGISASKDLPIIQCDNGAMGKELAENVINHGVQKKRVLVLVGNAMCSSVLERQKAFMKIMEDTQNECFLINTGQFDAEGILEMMERKKPDVVVALDTKILEELVKANDLYKELYPEEKVELYGVGCSNTILKQLENNKIVTIAVEDDFSIGYLGVQEAVKEIEGKDGKSENIRHILTNSNQMYSDDSQKLLFPFVK